MRQRRLLLGLSLMAVITGGAIVTSSELFPHQVENLVNLPERLYSRYFPPKKGQLKKLTEPEREAVRKLAGRLDALIVWSSNRDGNHELYLMDLRSMDVQRLTRNPSVDYFSRFSPDGRRIVFLRSQRPWVSFRDEGAWDVYLINTDGTGERLLARQGYHPTWTADGRHVLFQRGNRVMRIDLSTGLEEEIFDGNRVLGGRRIGDPELSADGRRLALAVDGYGAVVFDLEARRLTRLTDLQACQTTWGADDGSILWVAAEGAGGSRVMQSSPEGTQTSVFMDLPGKFSHEYFPKLSNDGRWLIWGAAAEGHEHDRADYEIFLWEVGRPWEDAIRLTYYSGNDQWPDLFVRGKSP